MNTPVAHDLTPDLGLNWGHAFRALGPDFFSDVQPQPLAAPYWVGTSPAVARDLGLDASWLSHGAALQAFAGNQLPAGSQPLASVYSGHQFGAWAGQLGDGRACLLGDVPRSGHPGDRLEIQLKGAGLTPYSRMGDGRAVLRSSIREFLCSEAMHGLGIPTTRALCVVGSPAAVRRETVETAAVVTRVAPSFIRFGHFEHFSYSGQHEHLRHLADHVIDRFYPACREASDTDLDANPYLALLQSVSQRTAVLLAQWQAAGFCHGVMNTDNMSILGLTIDYGPFQFLDGFKPGNVCNHSDHQGRYAYNRQPNIAYWNLFCLGQALLPLIGDQDQAVAALQTFQPAFLQAAQAGMRAKLGLPDARKDDGELAEALLRQLAQGEVDYTIFWRRLSHALGSGNFEPVRDLMPDRDAFDGWLAAYLERLQGQDLASISQRMLRINPKFVLRNHLGEQAIVAARQGDMSLVARLLTVLSAPYDEHPEHEALADFPPDWAASIEISCSS